MSEYRSGHPIEQEMSDSLVPEWEWRVRAEEAAADVITLEQRLAAAEAERKAAEETMCAAMEGRSHAIERALQAEAERDGLRLAGDTLMRLLRIRVDWDVEDADGLPLGEHDERDVLEARITEQENAISAWRRAAAAGSGAEEEASGG